MKYTVAGTEYEIPVGNDFLAGIHFQEAVIRSLRKDDVGGIFLTTFQKKDKDDKKVDAKRFIEKILKQKKLSQLVVHLEKFDKTHAYLAPDKRPQMWANLEWCSKMQEKYPHTRLLVSFFCEHNHPVRVMKPIFDKGRQLAPNIAFVNSIWKGQEVPNTITEIHIENAHTLPPIPKNEFTLSFDGFGGDKNDPRRCDFPDANIFEILKKYILSNRLIHIRAWNFRHNGKKSHLDAASVDNRKHFPNAPYLLGSIYTLAQREGAEWSKDRLYKTFADDHGGVFPKTKDCKAMVILPDVDSDRVHVFDIKGSNICMMTTQGLPPHTGVPAGKRFYADLFASQIADKAYKNTGSYLVRIGSNPLLDARLRGCLFRGK